MPLIGAKLDDLAPRWGIALALIGAALIPIALGGLLLGLQLLLSIYTSPEVIRLVVMMYVRFPLAEWQILVS